MVAQSVAVALGVSVLVGVLYGVAAVVVRRQGEPGTQSLTVALAIVAVAGLATPGVYWLQLPSLLADAWALTLYVGLAVALVPWLSFVLHYTGNGAFVRPWRIVGATVGVVALLSVLGWSAAAPSAVTGLVGVTVRTLGTLTFLSLLVLLVAGTVLLTYATYSYDTVRGVEGLGLVAPVAVPAVVGLFGVETAAAGVLRQTAAFAVGAVCLLATVWWLDTLETTPAAGRFGRRRLADEITDPVAFLDADEDVIEANDAFERQFDVRETAVVGDPLPAVVGETLSALVDSDSVELITDEGRRQFAPRVTELTDHHGRVRGTIVVLPDITDQKLREQRLAVLNRVVRHNLRNELSVVRGFAEEIGTEGVADDEAADRIVEASDNLMALGERAREAAELLDHDPETERVDLAAFLGEIAGDLHDESATLTVETRVPDDATVETDPALLHRSVEHLARNAVVHNDAEEPRVELVVETDRDGTYPVVIAVRDNGPGIPAHEWTAIEEGEETPLEHGSGLGLWAVRWAVTRLGGELRYEPNEPRGSVVRLRLPAAEDREAAPTAAARPDPVGEPP